MVGDYAAIETLLESTAVDIVYSDGSPLTPTDFPNFATGWGEIDALAAVQMAVGMCGNSVVYGTVTSESEQPISGAMVELTGVDPVNNRVAYTNASGQYSVSVGADTFDLAVSAFGFLPDSVEGVVVADGAEVMQDFVLTELPNSLVTGVVYDNGKADGDSHGYPLYATLTFSMPGYSETVYTNPFTGEYEVVLYHDQDYSVSVQALVPGYQTLEAVIADGDISDGEQDYYLNVDDYLCSAPGYKFDYDFHFDFETGDHGFVASGTNGSWARGIPKNGPGAARSGSYVIATNPTGNYNPEELSFMTSPAIDLTGYGTNTPVIEFWQWRNVHSNDYTSLEVTKDGGTTWSAVHGPISVTPPDSWNKVQVVLDASYNVADFQLRFKFESDLYIQYEGWYIDDIGISIPSIPGTDAVYSEDFDTDDGGFTISGSSTSWEWGEPAETPGPGAAHSAPNVWTTNLDGNHNVRENSYITSPVIDLSAYTGEAPTLTFWHYMLSGFNTYDWGSVQVTKDGGATWEPVYQKFGNVVNWTKVSLVLDSSYSVSNFQFRFHFYAGFMIAYPGWYIDDIEVTYSEPFDPSPACVIIDGGIVTGYVYDANFPTEKLIGVELFTPPLGHALTTANIGDPDHSGLYYMFQPTENDPDDIEFTLEFFQYETKTETRSIAQDVVNHEDFEIGSGILSTTPTNLVSTIPLHGEPVHTTLTLNNTGAGSANFTIYEVDKGFQPYSIPAFTGEIATNSKPASIYRDPEAAETVGSLELSLNSSRYGITAAPPAYGVDLFNNTLHRWNDASVAGVSDLIGSLTYGASSLYAGDFMGSDFSTFYAISYDFNSLVAIDTITAEHTIIATVTPPDGAIFTGLAGGPEVMYGMATACNSSSTLVEIDITTGEINTIGTLSDATCIIDIAYVPDTGMLYGVDLLTDSLYRINPATGAETLVGSLGVDANYAQGMDYDEVNNVLYWASYTTSADLRIIDIHTGASALIGSFSQGEVDSYAIAAGGIGDISWLETDPFEGYVSAFDDFEIQIEFNVDDIDQPGEYSAELKISSDTPYFIPAVPVTLHVVRPSDYGNIKGYVSATGKCDIDPAPFNDATIKFYKDDDLIQSINTQDDGYYSYSLENGSYDVEVIANGYVSQMHPGVVVGMNTDTVVDIELRLLDTCVILESDSYYQELAPDNIATQTMTLNNTGALEAPFEIIERVGAGPVPYNNSFDIELILDDDVFEDAIGLGGSAQFMILNRFTPDEEQFPFYLEQVDIFYQLGTVSTGDPLRIVVYKNTNSSEDIAEGSELLYMQDAVVEIASGWNSVILDEPVHFDGPGDVIIGAIFLKKPGSAYYPASIDLTTSHQRSWIGWWKSADAPEEPVLPADGTFALIDDLGFPGNWAIRGMGSAGVTEIPWLTEDPNAGVIPPDGGSMDVTLEFNSTGLTLGDYLGSLRVKTGKGPSLNVPVQLRLLPSPDHGIIQGRVSTLEVCDVNPAPASYATIKFFQNDELMYSGLTSRDGSYQTALLGGIYDAVAEKTGFETQTIEDVVVTASGEAVLDIDLRLLAPCIQANPKVLEKWLLTDTTDTQFLTLINSGAGEAVFEILEQPGLQISSVQKTPESGFNYAPESNNLEDLSRQAPRNMVQAPPYMPKDTLISEGFEESSPPEGWETRSLSQFTWGRLDTDSHTGTYHAAVFHDPFYNEQNEWLVSPEFRASEGFLSFWSIGNLFWCRDDYDGCDLNIWLVIGEIGGGDDIFLQKADDDWAATWVWSQTVIDLTPHLTGEPVRIGFQYAGNDGAQVGLDDVLIDGIQIADVPWLSEDPTAGIIPAGESIEIEITYDATGLDLGDYHAVLRINHAPAPTLKLPVTMHVVDELPVFYIYLPLLLK